MLHESQPDTSNRPNPTATYLAIGALVLCLSGGGYWWWSDSPATTPQSDLGRPTATSGLLPASLGESWKNLDDPRKDGWDIEEFNQQASKILKKLATVLGKPDAISAQQLSGMVTSGFRCDHLLPRQRQSIFDDHEFSVERTAERTQVVDDSSTHQGAQGLADALQTLVSSMPEAQDIRCKFKLFRVRREDRQFVTDQYLSVSGRTQQGYVEQNATWRMRWQRTGTSSPKIMQITVSNFEQVVHKGTGGPLFRDCTQAVLSGNDCYKEQFLFGRNHWLNRSQDTRYTYLLGNPGLAVGDVNGDGLDDLYACQEEGLPNRLFLQQPDGTALDVSKAWGVDWLHNSRGALLLDLDNDGDQDLVVAMVGGIATASNDGQRFTLRAFLPSDEDLMSLCAADYDQDADLDIYVCAYNGNSGLDGSTRGGLIGGAITSNTFDRPNGGRNTLFRNDITKDAWLFTDVTDDVGLVTELQPLSLAAAWDDYDNDGDPDLYVANDYGNNQLFRNQEGTFVEVTQSSGVTDRGFGMSVTWGDYDRDGLMDVYVSNMFSAAGNRITFQPQFLEKSPVMKRQLQRFARGNTLLKNRGPEQDFRDVSQQAAVTIGRWAWSSNFVDINNDGWEDLVVANGYVTTEDTGDL